jgi:hypothetical protein
LLAAALLSGNAVQLVRKNLCEECFHGLLLQYDAWHAEAGAQAIRLMEPRAECFTGKECP